MKVLILMNLVKCDESPAILVIMLSLNHKPVALVNPIFTNLGYSLIPAVLCLLGFGNMSGQSVTISSESVKVEYYRMPDEPLPSNYTTYTADLDISFTELSKSGFTESHLVDTYLNLEGYKRVHKDGDVEITAKISDLIIWNESRATTRSKTKDKNGKEITKYQYRLELKYSMPMVIKVVNKEGKTLLDEYIFSMSDTRTWTSPSYNSMSDLDSYWRIQRNSRLSDIQKDLIREGMKKATDLVNNGFGFRLMQEKVKFATIGKQKHPDYDRFQKNVEILQSAFEQMSADKDLEEVREKAMPALEFYAATANKYKNGNKDQKKINHICLYNQALAYFWLEDFDLAESYAEAIKKFDSKNKDVRRLLENIAYTRNSLINAGRASRHQVLVSNKT